jgi:hypothetical protein
MVYINLSNPVKDFTRIRIKDFTVYEQDNGMLCVGYNYQVYKKFEGKYISFYDRHINLIDQDYVKKINTKDTRLTPIEIIHRYLLEYIIDEKLENGTIELELTNG